MPRTVLLADDSVTAQNMGRRILTDAGYEVITVNNGSAALKKIHENHPDLIVLDVYMPGYGGLEVCQRLKESGETMRIPVLLSVGKMEPFKAEEAKRVRADAHIVKPFEASELLAALAKLEDRIVPQADSSRGRKSKKPSFWHEDDAAAPGNDAQGKPEGSSNIPKQEAASHDESAPPKIGAFPLVREATGEMPVIADSAAAEFEEPVAAVGTARETQVPTELQGVEASAQSDSRRSKDGDNADAQDSYGGGKAINSVALDCKAAETTATPTIDAVNAVSNGRWVAENVAVSPEEAALELEEEMRAAEAEAHATEAPEVAQPESHEDRGATFAAAAGASSVSIGTSTVSRNDEPEPPLGAESTAAWENWQTIRDNVMNAHGTAAIAETIAEIAKAGISEDQVQSAATPKESAVPESTTENRPELEAGSLSSIVDSVLAELKPRLMEEIAKKLKK